MAKNRSRNGSSRAGRNSKIEYRSGEGYEPDFVVETTDRILLAEVKAGNELQDPVVLAKAQAAVKWCRAASQHAAESEGKPWSYLLVSDKWLTGSATLQGLMATCTKE